jgi:hypothetical protein
MQASAQSGNLEKLVECVASGMPAREASGMPAAAIDTASVWLALLSAFYGGRNIEKNRGE